MKATLNYLHHQATDWLRELDFYTEELSILTTRLEEAVARNTAQDVLAQAEHFQNKFIVLKKEIDELKNNVGVREGVIENMTKEKPTHAHEKIALTEDVIFEDMKDLIHTFAETRFEFNKFLSKTF